MRSTGEGAEDGLDFLITRASSSSEMGVISMAQSGFGRGAEGIQDGELKR